MPSSVFCGPALSPAWLLDSYPQRTLRTLFAMPIRRPASLRAACAPSRQPCSIPRPARCSKFESFQIGGGIELARLTKTRPDFPRSLPRVCSLSPFLCIFCVKCLGGQAQRDDRASVLCWTSHPCPGAGSSRWRLGPEARLLGNVVGQVAMCVQEIDCRLGGRWATQRSTRTGMTARAGCATRTIKRMCDTVENTGGECVRCDHSCDDLVWFSEVC